MLLFLLLNLVSSSAALVNGPSCCAMAKSDTCKNQCQQADSVGNLLLICPTSMERQLWTCISPTSIGNSSEEVQDNAISEPSQSKPRLTATKQRDEMAFRGCCSLSPVHRCQSACFAANQTADLNRKCRRSDNIQFFHCLSTIQEGEECCGTSPDILCRKACLALYSATATSVSGAGSNRTLRKAVNSSCFRTPRVLNCARKLLKADRFNNRTSTVECCNRGETFSCRKACKEAMKASKSSNEVFDILVEDCGTVNLTDNPLWQCFLRNSAGTSNASSNRVSNDVKQRSSASDSRSVFKASRISFDAAKLSCCDRGTQQCHQLCRKAYTEDYAKEYDELQRCVRHPAESTMASCLQDVEEPCQPGCSNLSFCSSFGNRPVELFRNCNPEADATAQKVFQEWIHMPRVLLPGWDVKMWGPATCLTSYWKALACVLQFKPCKRNMIQTVICKKDCVKLLQTCMTQPNDTLTSELCDYVTQQSFNEECISLEDYLSPRPKMAAVVAPCKFNNCKANEICVVDHYSPDGYNCLPGCRFGEMSKMLGFSNTWVQFPTSSLACPYNSCNEVCYCTTKSELQQCHTPAFQPFESCWIADYQIDHGRRLQIKCNNCICHYGELVCTKYHCDDGDTALKWSCPIQAFPVCSSTGRRYLNACFSQWQNTSEQFYPCQRSEQDVASQCYTAIKLVYSQKQIDRLNRLTNGSAIFTATLVEKSLQYLMTYLHCRISIFHGVDGELLAMISSRSQSQLHCDTCQAEAEKLVMLFENRSPQVSLSIQLDVILLAEIVQIFPLHPSETLSGTTILQTKSSIIYIIPIFTFLFYMYRFRFAY